MRPFSFRISASLDLISNLSKSKWIGWICLSISSARTAWGTGSSFFGSSALGVSSAGFVTDSSDFTTCFFAHPKAPKAMNVPIVAKANAS
jgi:hypothetical protein